MKQRVFLRGIVGGFTGKCPLNIAKPCKNNKHFDKIDALGGTHF